MFDAHAHPGEEFTSEAFICTSTPSEYCGIRYCRYKAAGYLPAETVENVKNWFYGMSAGGVLGLFAGITAAIVIISYVCSRRIMAKKEF